MLVAGVLVAIRRSGTGAGDGAVLAAGQAPAVPTPSSPPEAEPRPASTTRAGSVPAAPAPPRRTPVSAADVANRPRPASVNARGRWTARLDGSGDRLALYAPTVAVDALDATTVGLVSPDPRSGGPGGAGGKDATALAFPDGSRWYPLQGFSLGGAGNVPLTSATVRGDSVSGWMTSAGFAELVDASQPTVTGRFVSRDGQETAQMRLPTGTRVAREGSSGIDTFSVSITAVAGMRLDVRGGAGNEVEVAGSVRGQALGSSWEGLVGSLEADDVVAGVTRADGTWAVAATARTARQLWIDVWPVVDTVLEATAQVRSPSFFDSYSLRLVYANAGFATAQIFEAEAIGGSNSVNLGIKQTGTHDAGIGVHRGGREINLASGAGIDSHLPPGDRHDRGLSYTPGVPVTLVLRGNFPEVRVTLPIAAAPAA